MNQSAERTAAEAAGHTTRHAAEQTPEQMQEHAPRQTTDRAIYTMKETCAATGLPYETLKFYCNQGLVPLVARDANNYRIFTERNVAWIKSLTCLKKCGMSIAEMREYLDLCLQGPESIPARKEILTRKKSALETKKRDLEDSLNYIDWKQGFYDDVLAGKTEYISNLVAD